MEDLWEIMSNSPRKRQEQPGRDGYQFDDMGYALPMPDDTGVIEAVRLISKATLEYAQILPLGEPKSASHDNCKELSPRFGGAPIRGYKVEVTANGILEMVDHSVIRQGERVIDVTPYYNSERSCFVASERELAEIEEPVLNPLKPDYGRLVRARPSFYIPLSEQAQRVMVQRMEMVGKKVRQRDIGDDSRLNRHHILVMRY